MRLEHYYDRYYKASTEIKVYGGRHKHNYGSIFDSITDIYNAYKMYGAFTFKDRQGKTCLYYNTARPNRPKIAYYE